MPEFTVWTNQTDKQTLRAHGFREAAKKYHEDVGAMPENWDGSLYVRDEDSGEERTFRFRKAA